MHYHDYNRNILLTGGLGDAITILSWLPDPPKRILIASSRAALIAELCHHLQLECEVLESQRTYQNKAELEQYIGEVDAYDCSIIPFFKEIKEGKHKYMPSRIHTLKLHDMVGSDYILVVPSTATNMPGRNLTKEDFDYIFENTTGALVVSQYNNFKIPPAPRILDLTNRTSLIESIGLCHHAKAYFGVDSWQGILCCQSPMPCCIKSINPQFYNNIKCYLPEKRQQHKVMPHFIGCEKDKVREPMMI